MRYILFFLILSFNRSLSQPYHFYRYDLKPISYSLDSQLNLLRSLLYRDILIDSCVQKRTDYYLDVIEKNLSSGKNFDELFSKIPRDTKAHQKLFGAPEYFISPVTDYPEMFRDVKESGVRIKGEIMQEIIWSKGYESRQDPKSILIYAIKNISLTNNKSIHSFIIQNYQNSPHHSQIIKKMGRGKYGISTKALISERKYNGLWNYKVIIYNMINFTKPLKV